MPSSKTMVKLIVLGVAGTQAAAGVIEARTSLGFKLLFARQTTDCTTICSPLQNAVDLCEDTSCLCTSDVAVALNDCVNCYYQQLPTPDVEATANELINQYESTCSAYNLPPASVTTTPSASTVESSATASTDSGTSSTASSSTSSSTFTSTAGGATTTAPPGSPYPPLTLPQARPPFATASAGNAGGLPGSGVPTTGNPGSGVVNGNPPPGANGALPNTKEGWWPFVAAAPAMLAILAL